MSHKRETIENILFGTGRFTECQCTEIADLVLKEFEGLSVQPNNQLPDEVVDDIQSIHKNLREWCYAKRTENERADNHKPLFTCMDEAIILILADMELRLRKLENKSNGG